ncbi:MAG TPA: hypothetical protein IAC43_01205 [Candidatus Faecivivens stercoripullorum]|uniref:Lyzozyme M1 (1,4-beta-N-acetylmuramidase) n=1 Tax=Candidatus Faecivivens stercoripullorum TaxID=2840805 RepID=A0A9D1H528_9FIRM|nr:hypothetical protein [Candidatus Faecivivens stercoripullorum]
MEQDKKNTSTGEWEFEIDIDSIRSQAQKEAESADSLIAELDRMARRDDEPDDLDPSASDEPEQTSQETTRVISTAGASASDSSPADSDETAAQTEDITTEQTVIIPAASPSARRTSQTASSTAGTRPVANTRSASSAGRASRTVSQDGTSQASGSNGKKAPAPKASLTPAQERRMKRAQRKREKRLARVERSRQRPKFRLAPVLASLLAITNVVTLGGYGLSYIQTRLTVQEAEKTAQQSQEEAETLRSEMDELQKNSISVDTFTNLVAEYNMSAQFIQEFFDDRIVYKDTSVHYAPIDESLPMNSYDWQYLSWGEDGRPSYTPDGERHATLGVDVSYHQGEIDWEAVAADGIQFAMIRCGYRGYGNGDLVTDSCYQGNMQRALDNGLDVGVYFFSQAITEEEAVEEAEYVLSLLEGYTVEMPVVFDMEILQDDARANNLTSAERAQISKAFCDTIRAAGYTPMIYGNTAYYMSKVDFASLAGEYGIWLAQYYDEPFFPYQFNMWQYTNNGTVDGIAGTVDINLYFGE